MISNEKEMFPEELFVSHRGEVQIFVKENKIYE